MITIVFCIKFHSRVQIANSLAPVCNAKPFLLSRNCWVQLCIYASPVLNVLTLKRLGLNTYGPKITLPDDGLTSNGAKPSTGTEMTAKLYLNGFFSYQWFQTMFLLIRWYSKWPMRSCEVIPHINLYCTGSVSFQADKVNIMAADGLAPLSPSHHQPWYWPREMGMSMTCL